MIEQTTGVLAGLARFWNEDRSAFLVVGAFFLLQVLLGSWVWARTWRHLRAGRLHLQALAELARTDASRAASHARRGGERLERAWRVAWGDAAERGQLDPAEAFAPVAVLSPSYNHRLDAAAPGAFTALGILGTFIGLILGFLRIDPDVATTNVAPLLGGMVVAFLNSALGVILSVFWSLRARVVRQEFDLACAEVVNALYAADRAPPQTAVLLTALEQRIEQLATSTAKASGELLRSLSTSVGESVASVVDLPFHQLHERIARLDDLIGRTAVQQAELHSALVTTASQVDSVRQALADGISQAAAIVATFSSTLEALRMTSDGLEAISGALAPAVADFTDGTSRLDAFVVGIDAFRQPLAEMATSLRTQQQALDTAAERFEGATANLTEAVATIRDVASVTARESAASVQVELQAAIDAMNRELVRLTETNVAAYETATQRVIDVVDSRVTDLTDRMSAELATLSARLPEAVETMHQSTRRMQEQLQVATHRIGDALRELSERTPEALRVQLQQFDQALARAMDHFSGTLHQWDGKVDELGSLARSIESLTPRLQPPPITPPVAP